MPMCVFYDKTNIVILTCTSDNSLPSSPLRRVAVDELGTLVNVNWVCPEGLPDVRGRQRAFYTYGRGKNVVHECRGELGHGLVRRTGKYDNIDFIIKPHVKIKYNPVNI